MQRAWCGPRGWGWPPAEPRSAQCTQAGRESWCLTWHLRGPLLGQIFPTHRGPQVLQALSFLPCHLQAPGPCGDWHSDNLLQPPSLGRVTRRHFSSFLGRSLCTSHRAEETRGLRVLLDGMNAVHGSHEHTSNPAQASDSPATRAELPSPQLPGSDVHTGPLRQLLQIEPLPWAGVWGQQPQLPTFGSDPSWPNLPGR